MKFCIFNAQHAVTVFSSTCQWTSNSSHYRCSSVSCQCHQSSHGGGLCHSNSSKKIYECFWGSRVDDRRCVRGCRFVGATGGKHCDICICSWGSRWGVLLHFVLKSAFYKQYLTRSILMRKWRPLYSSPSSKSVIESHACAFFFNNHFLQPVLSQDKRDNDMKKLLETIKDAYTHVNGSHLLTDLDDYRKTLLKDMSMQTVECAYFIKDHFNDKSFRKFVQPMITS